MKIVRFENGKFGVRRWNWKHFRFELMNRRTGDWKTLKSVSSYREVIEMTYEEANDWIDSIEYAANRDKPIFDRGTVVSRKGESDRIRKGRSM